VFPDSFWQSVPNGDLRDTKLSLINLRDPTTINEILDLLSIKSPSDLGVASSVSLYEKFDSELDHARMLQADRERLLTEP
jgi:hypothetical protein